MDKQKDCNQRIISILKDVCRLYDREGVKSIDQPPAGYTAESFWALLKTEFHNGRCGSGQVLPMGKERLAETIASELGLLAVNGVIFLSVDNFSCSISVENVFTVLKEFISSTNWIPKKPTLPELVNIKKSDYQKVAESYPGIDPIQENVECFKTNVKNCEDRLRDHAQFMSDKDVKALKKMLATWQEKLQIWEGIYQKALRIDYEQLNLEKAAASNKALTELFYIDYPDPSAYNYDITRSAAQERWNEKHPLLTWEYGISMSQLDAYKLFLKHGVEPRKDDVWLFTHAVPDNFFKFRDDSKFQGYDADGHPIADAVYAYKSFDEYFQEMSAELEALKERENSKKYKTNAGTLRSEYSSRWKRTSKTYEYDSLCNEIDRLEGRLKNLAKYEREIKEVMNGANVPVSTGI